MALDFPSSPTVGQKFPVSVSAGQPQWQWDGVKWIGAAVGGSVSSLTPGPGIAMSPNPIIATGVVSLDTSPQTTGPLAGMRNMIINGDFRIDQRWNGASIATPGSNFYSGDCWKIINTQACFTVTSRLPGGGGSAGAYYLGMQVSTPRTAAAGDAWGILQTIEGLNMGHLHWGFAGARPVTVSGIINCSLTGNIAVSLRNGASNMSYITFINIPVANTDTPFAITIPGPTSGTWNLDNSIGILLGFDLGSGTTWRAPSANNWLSGSYLTASGALAWVGTNLALFYLKDIQLEVGSQATPFERRQLTTELALCQRYYQNYIGSSAGCWVINGYSVAGGAAQYTIILPVTMRILPTTTFSGSWTLSNANTPIMGATSAGSPTGGQVPNATVLAFYATAVATGALAASANASSGYVFDSSF